MTNRSFCFNRYVFKIICCAHRFCTLVQSYFHQSWVLFETRFPGDRFFSVYCLRRFFKNVLCPAENTGFEWRLQCFETCVAKRQSPLVQLTWNGTAGTHPSPIPIVRVRKSRFLPLSKLCCPARETDRILWPLARAVQRWCDVKKSYGSADWTARPRRCTHACAGHRGRWRARRSSSHFTRTPPPPPVYPTTVPRTTMTTTAAAATTTTRARWNVHAAAAAVIRTRVHVPHQCLCDCLYRRTYASRWSVTGKSLTLLFASDFSMSVANHSSIEHLSQRFTR